MPDQIHSQPKTERKAAYHHGSLRRTIIDAALRLCEERGPAAFTLAEICRSAGVSVAAPYRHFDSREQVLAEAALEGFEKLNAQCAAVLSTAARLDQALLELARCYLVFARDQPAHFLLMFSNSAGVLQAHKPRLAIPAGPRAYAHLSPPDSRGEAAVVAAWQAGARLFDTVRDGLVQLAPTARAAGLTDAQAADRLASAFWCISHGAASLWHARQLDADWADNDFAQVLNELIKPWIAGKGLDT